MSGQVKTKFPSNHPVAKPLTGPLPGDYSASQLQLQLWKVFKLFSTHVPVPNGEFETEDVAALFDHLIRLAECSAPPNCSLTANGKEATHA